MSESKKGFTLIEVLIVVVLLIATFSMSLSILGSFSTSKNRYVESDIDSLRILLQQIKYFQIQGEEGVTVDCENGRVRLLVGGVVDEIQLKYLSCTKDNLKFKEINSSSTVVAKISKYGYVSFERI